MSSSTKTKSVRRLKIQPYKSSKTSGVQNNSTSTSDVEAKWGIIKHAIDTIFKKDNANLPFEELYNIAFTLILQKHGDRLYLNLENQLNEFLNTQSSLVSCSSDSLLRQTSSVWKHYTTSLVMIRDILMYMDRVFVESENKLYIYDLGLNKFINVFFVKNQMGAKLGSVMLNNIAKDRSGDQIDRATMHSTVSILVELGLGTYKVYEEFFQEPFLKETARFYRTESDRLFNENDASVYLEKIANLLDEEDQRVDRYMDPITKSKVQYLSTQILITDRVQDMMTTDNAGILLLIKDGRNDDLRRMYNMFERVPERKALDKLMTFLSEYIRDEGLALNATEDTKRDPITWVSNVIDMRDKYELLIKKSFNEDKMFLTSVNEMFASFTNKNQRLPEYVSLFMDDKLKKNQRGLSEEEIEERLVKSIAIFRYIYDKDIFERYYKKHLAKRLLFGRSASDDCERSMISKLRVECGYQFTSKLEGMFNDIRLSKDAQVVYKSHIAKGIENGAVKRADMIVNVLTMSYWPMPSVHLSCNLPSQLASLADHYKNFYFSQHTGRRLTWQPHLGTVDIRAAFKTRKHDLNMSTFAAVVLLLFSDPDGQKILTFDEIKKATEIENNELKRTLQSLACAKYKILLKQPKSKDIGQNDKFAFNSKFTANLTRIKIQTVSGRVEANTDVKKTMGKVDEDRKHAIDAALVRVMKSRNVLEHNLLIAEVTTLIATHFRPDLSMIKRRIESLIEREYLERDEDNRRSYKYLA